MARPRRPRPKAPLLACGVALLASSLEGGATAHPAVPVPSTNQDRERGSSTPPAGPLPDPLDDADESCPDDAVDGTCHASLEPSDYVPGQYIDAYFAGLDEDEACVDESEECEELAGSGECMADQERMETLGCHRSCLYCLTPASRELFSMGVDQIAEKSDDSSDDNDDDDETLKQEPSASDIAEVLARTERYFIGQVLVHEELAKYRLSCQNFKRKCAYWAAQGYCSKQKGYMGMRCPAACQMCPMVDLKERCPIDETKNIFQPGDINAMFERLLEEAGQDVSKFSSENLPTGGKHPLGELEVITSPYHDMLQYVDEDDEDEDPETWSALPWTISIDSFLSDGECDRLIELGETKGYRKSTEYGEAGIDGSPEFIVSKSRTSTNTFCNNGCEDDPVVKSVIGKMTKLTGIPYDYFEDLQLVRYEEGQYYHQHHDWSEFHVEKGYGARILTVFLYLNDDYSGGGTKFEDLDFTATPKRGMALVWPSITNADVNEMDDWTWHEALPVDKGVKFGANAWIHLRDFQNSPDYC